MTLWKVHCMEDTYPGMWNHWYRHQCAAVGWPPDDGFRFSGRTKDNGAWGPTRTLLKQIRVGDWVIVSLKGNRVGRLGEVTELRLDDDQWSPLVPRRPDLPTGEQGRRIHVRWDLTCGPEDRDLVVELPVRAQFKGYELRKTIAAVKSRTLEQLREVMNDRSNWTGIAPQFRYERALSDYIAAYPHRLEEGLAPHPDAKVREMVFKEDRTRLDVLLLDRDGRAAIVECKQHSPTVHDVKQLRHYMELLRRKTGRRDARGILVHGGARRLSPAVQAAADKVPAIEVISYRLEVEFLGSSSL